MSRFRKSGRQATQRNTLLDGVVVEADRAPIWGVPRRCPECDNYGMIDSLDPVRRVMAHHCPGCWHRWDVCLRELDRRPVPVG